MFRLRGSYCFIHATFWRQRLTASQQFNFTPCFFSKHYSVIIWFLSQFTALFYLSVYNVFYFHCRFLYCIYMIFPLLLLFLVTSTLVFLLTFTGVPWKAAQQVWGRPRPGPASLGFPHGTFWEYPTLISIKFLI